MGKLGFHITSSLGSGLWLASLGRWEGQHIENTCTLEMKDQQSNLNGTFGCAIKMSLPTIKTLTQ